MLHNLPSGYAELEYIQSSGTQYIDTGFKPKNTTKVIADFQVTTKPTSHLIIFGSRTNYGSTDQFVLGFAGHKSPAVWRSDFGNAQASFPSTVGWSSRYTAVFDSSACVLNTDSVNNSNTTFTSTHNLFLLADNDNETAAGYISAKLYSCQIFEDDVLVRNFIPAKNSAGTAGLYDLVNGAFYASAGTDAFTAGPEKETPVPVIAAATISANPSDGGASVLVTVTVENAESITGTVGGSSVAWTQADGTWSTVAARSENEVYPLVLQAVDAQGASHQLTTTLYYGVLNLIDDRTSADVALVLDLAGKVSAGTATAAELAQWMTDLRGAYNASDLNRVGGAVAYVADRLTAYGYAVAVAPRQGWTPVQIPTTAGMTAYLADVQALRAALTVPSDTPAVPEDMDQLTWQEANDIERILTVVDALLTRMAAAWFYSGDLYAGEVV